ncbi:hypothetical protein MD484_g4838, partial [Candolleomyces efflorescens]
MEGYYDGVIFHRIMPSFLVQTGDRTGTGNGGESFYGEPFEDEIHPRLRYAHRGLVGMANNGTKNSNDSQFFITLDRADELHGKHTLFGRVMGDTIYNVMKIGEMEIDKDNRPVYPPKIKSIRIIDNPFDDIIPRITAAERKAQLKAREEAQKEREEEQRKKGAKKNVKLLSFGADEEANEEEETSGKMFKKKSIFRPDLVETPQSSIPIPDFTTTPASSSKSKAAPSEKDAEEPSSKRKEKEKAKKEEDITKIREKHEKEKNEAADSHKSQIARMEADIRKLSRLKRGDDSSDDEKKRKPKVSYLEQELSKYTKGRAGKKTTGGRGKRDESDVLAALNSFRDKLKSAMPVDDDDDEGGGSVKRSGDDGDVEMRDTGREVGDDAAEAEEEEPIEVDDDFGFMTHSLHFPKGNDEEVNKAEREYEVIDPRARGAKAREEERERKSREKGKGHRSSRYGGGGGGGGGHRDRDGGAYGRPRK